MLVLTFLCLPLLGAGLPEALLRDLIPATFPLRDPSNYTIRYLSQLQGSDTEDCLVSQLHAGTDSSAQVQSCRTLRYALTGQHSGQLFEGIHNLILLVSAGTYPYNVNRPLEVYNSSNLIIAKHPLLSGEATLKCDALRDDQFNNLHIFRTENVALRDLTFTQCGPFSYAVSLTRVTNIQFHSNTFRDNLNAGLIILRGRDLLLEGNVFVNNTQTALITALIDNVTLQDTLFENNTATFSYNYYPDLRFGFRRAGALSISYENSTGVSHRILIRNCTFRSNHAGINMSNSTDAGQRPILYIPRGHGGGLHISFQNATGHEVAVENCSFIRNLAELTGGAISVLFYRGIADTNEVKSSSRNNTVRIDNTVFRENECSGNGGAISANTFEAANSSKVVVTNSSFQQNRANRGGAFSFIIEDNIVINSAGQITNVPIIQGSSFVGNQSPQGGSAISLVSNARVDQGIEKAKIHDCTFADNIASIHGALLSLRFPISLSGNNIFRANKEGAITLLQTQMATSGSTLFHNNSAQDGGAIKMAEESRIHLLDRVNVTFHQNHANRHGGAMKVISQYKFDDLSFTRFYNGCFIQPLTPRDKATAVTYSSNTAGVYGAAIYATTLLPCTRRVPYLEEEERMLQIGNFYNNSLFVEPPFQFSDNNNIVTGRPEAIATEPSYFRVSPLSLSGAPGQTLHLRISVEGQTGNPQEAVWSANLEQNRFFSLNAGGMLFSPVVKYPQVQRSYEDICNQPYEEGLELEVLDTTHLDFSIIQTTSGIVVNTTSVSLNITCCNPAYVFDNKTLSCVEDQALQSVILRPDSDNKYIYIMSQTYASWRQGSLVWASIPVIFKNCTRDPSGSLPGCLFKYNNPNDQCRNNRTGFLCGRCPAGEAVDLTLTRCVKCQPWHSFMIAAIIVAFVVMCALVMIFNVGIPNEMRGFLFYIQVIGFVYTIHVLERERLDWEYHLSSVFGFSLYIPLCPYPGYDALYTAAFSVILPITAVITIVIYIISAKFIRHLSNKNSFDGIWFLTLIIYKFVADICFNILRCQKVNNGKPNEYVYYYDGDVQCFTSEEPIHLCFAVVALILSVLIILFPICILVISYRRFRLTVNITDILNKDLQPSCKWWASFDLFRRLLIIFIVLLSNYIWPLYVQLALFFSGLFVFFTFACAQPYTSRRANITEALILADFVLVSAIFLNRDVTLHDKFEPLELLLLLLPFLFAVVFLILYMAAYLWKKISPTDFNTALITVSREIARKIGAKTAVQLNQEPATRHPTIARKRTLRQPSGDNESATVTVDPDFSTVRFSQYREELLADYD